MKIYDTVALVGWCSYCKCEIHSDDRYEEEGDEMWHIDCVDQMNTYVDEFGDNHRYEQ